MHVADAIATSAAPIPLTEPDLLSRVSPARVLEMADRHRWVLFGFLLVLYAVGFNGQWRLEPDSALYLTIGRNLAENRGYTYHGLPHHLAFPGPPLLFAATFRAFHTRSLLPALVLMPFLGFCTLALVYRLFLLHAGRPVAVLMTFGVGISRLFYRYCFELLSDLPFLLGVMAFLAGFEGVVHARDQARRARWFDWALLIGGLILAVAMRPAMWALLLAIVGAVVISWIRTGFRWRQLVVCLAVAAAALAFYRLDPRHGGGTMGQYEDALLEMKLARLGPMLHQMVVENIPALFEASITKATFGCPLLPGLNTLFGIVVLALGLLLFRRRPLWGLWIAATVLMLLVMVKPLDRYFLPVLPLMVFAWWTGLVWIHRRLPQPWAGRVFVALFVLAAATNLARMSEVIVEQRWTPFLNHYKQGRYASSGQVAKLLHDHTREGDWILAPPKFGRILTFLSRRYATEPHPESPLDPGHQTVFVLEPIEAPVQDWIDMRHVRLGPAIGPTVKSKYDPAPWRLRRAEPESEAALWSPLPPGEG